MRKLSVDFGRFDFQKLSPNPSSYLLWLQFVCFFVCVFLLMRRLPVQLLSEEERLRVCACMCKRVCVRERDGRYIMMRY